jgi:hypothetical protein
MILWIVHPSFHDRRPLGLHVLDMAPYTENTCLLRHQHGLSGLLILSCMNHLESYSHKLVFVMFVEKYAHWWHWLLNPMTNHNKDIIFVFDLVLLNSVNGDDILVLHYKSTFILFYHLNNMKKYPFIMRTFFYYNINSINIFLTFVIISALSILLILLL